MDVVRGIAIILMVAAHTIAFYGPTSLAFLRYLGDALCFTIFLFLFGFSFFSSILQKKNDKEFKKKVLKRVGILLFSYYLIAFISLLSEPKSIATTINTLIFIHVPSLTEFMLPFIFYSALLPLLFHLINPIFKKSKIFVFLSFSFLGILFYIGNDIVQLS